MSRPLQSALCAAVVLSVVACAGEEAKQSAPKDETEQVLDQAIEEERRRFRFSPPGGELSAFGEPGESRSMIGSSASQSEILKHIRVAVATSFRPVGSTSVVFAAKLKGGINAAIKPKQKRKKYNFRSEIAAYRLGRLLGLDNVPPVISRRIGKNSLRTKLQKDYADAWPDIENAIIWQGPEGREWAESAAIYWIPNMRDLGLDSSSKMARWTRHLQQTGEIRESEMAWHRDISNMLVFDYLIGNMDRFSGANVQGTPDGDRVYIRDNDMGFLRLRQSRHEEILDHLGRTQKFSRRLVASLEALTADKYTAELSRDPLWDDTQVLNQGQIRAVLDRRDAVLSYVYALVEQYGEENVFVFD